MFLWFHIFLWFTYDFANSVGRVSLYGYLCMCICRHHGFVYLTCLEHPLASLKQLHKGAVALSMRILFFCRTGKSLCEPASLCTHFAKFRRTFLFIVCILFMYQFDCSRSLRIALFSFHLFLLIFFLFKSKTFFIEQQLCWALVFLRGSSSEKGPREKAPREHRFSSLHIELSYSLSSKISHVFAICRSLTVSGLRYHDTHYLQRAPWHSLQRQLHTVAIPRWAVVEP